MIVLVMFFVFAAGFAWAWPNDERKELDDRLKKGRKNKGVRGGED